MLKKLGFVLVLLNVVFALASAYFFLRMEELTVFQWLCLDLSAPCVLLFALGYFLGSIRIMSFSSVWLLAYAVNGLLFFEWKFTYAHLLPKAGHFLMLAAVIYILARAFMEIKWIRFLIWSAVGLIALAPVFGFQKYYQSKHPELVKQIEFKDVYDSVKSQVKR